MLAVALASSPLTHQRLGTAPGGPRRLSDNAIDEA
jgi:hypothetical protein